MSRTTDVTLLWKPKATGDYTVSLTISRQGDETLTDNNKLTAPDLGSAMRKAARAGGRVVSGRWEYRHRRQRTLA